MTRPYGERLAQYRSLLGEDPALAPLSPNLAPGDPAGAVAGLVLAPALGGFTQWLLAWAKGRGIKRLYFLARDGYCFLRAARSLSDAMGLGLDCRYLCCSRQALRLPLFHLDPQQGLDALCRNSMDLTLDKLLARAGLAPGERQAWGKALALPFGLGERLPRTALPQVRRALERSPVLLRLLEERSKAALPALAGYLRQEGLLEDVPCALVDSGWLGSLQQGLQTALSLLGRPAPLEGCYFGLYQVPTEMDRARYHSYLFAPEGPLGAKARFNNCVFEAVFTAPHGMTLGYRRAGGRWLPVLGEGGGHPLLGKLLPSFDQYLAGLAALCREQGLAAGLTQRREAVKKLLGAFFTAPWPQEAELFGSLPFSDEAAEGKPTPLAAPLTDRELMRSHGPARLLAQAGLCRPCRESAWPQASAVLYSAHPRRRLGEQALYQILRSLKQQAHHT